MPDKSKLRRKQNLSQGFTLIELMVTVGIIALALIGVLRLFIYCFSRFDNTVVNPLIRVLFGIVKGENYVISGEFGAIMPGGVVTQLKYIGILSGDVFPFLSQLWDEARGVFPDESFKDKAHPNISRTPGIVGVWRGVAPVPGAIGYGV